MPDSLPVPVQVPVVQPEPKPKRRGRPPRAVFDDATRQLVRDMATWGVPLKAMRQHVRDPNTGEPVSEHTLVSEFAREIEVGTATGDAALARNLWLQANGREAVYGEVNGKTVKLRDELKPQPGPAIFLSKVRLGYRETSVVEHRGFNISIFNDMKEQLGKLSRDDLIELGQRWQTKLRPKKETRPVLREESGGSGDGA
jgi:hypothetical protein